MADAEATFGLPASEHFREAQRLLLPTGVVWTDREAYDERVELFQRIQQKLYAMERMETLPAPVSAPVEPPVESAPMTPPLHAAPSSPNDFLSLWHFSPGVIVRVVQEFTDYDGQQILAGEVLHFVDSTYFFYEGAHTLRFVEKTIRLATIVDEEAAIIENRGNAWFLPIKGE
jgi:hypothetical protein